MHRKARYKDGSVVQWIEYQIPVLTIWVRIPSGSHTENRHSRLSPALEGSGNRHFYRTLLKIFAVTYVSESLPDGSPAACRIRAGSPGWQ